jgi:hypothetical protein
MRNQKSRLFSCLCAVVLIMAAAGCSSTTGKQTTIDLFNGKDLSGWSALTADPQVPMDQVWSVRDGVIHCQGTPVGAIYKGPKVTNFRLSVDYRWAPGGKPGNSGIFSRITPPLKPIPQTVEVQLKHGSAGDVMGLQGRQVATNQARFFAVKNHAVAGDIAGVRKLVDLEKPAGEWNRVEILAQGGHYTVWINGRLANEVEGVEQVPGEVGLQSEENAVEFRRVRLTPMD